MKIIKRLKFFWNRIHFVDKCLLFFLGVLLAQTAYTIFFGSASGKEADTIDIMVRTSSAAIFGYFVSANFDRSAKAGNSDYSSTLSPTSVKANPSEGPKGKIGFTAVPSSLEVLQTSTVKEDRRCYPKQEIIVAAIGVTALIILLLFRNFRPNSPSASGAVSQMRDFVSGCIGFLVSCVSERNSFSDSEKG